MTKRLFTILITVFAVISISSCVKVYHCHCTYDTANGMTKAADVTDYPVNKKTAQENCQEDDTYAKKIWGPASHCEL